MNKIFFVALLFIAALCGLLIGGHDLYDRYLFWADGQNGSMESRDPNIQRAYKLQQFDDMNADVDYVTIEGTVSVSGKAVSGEMVKRLAERRIIPVRFLKSDPRRVLFDNEELPVAWGWLGMGILLLLISLYALRLLRRESFRNQLR